MNAESILSLLAAIQKVNLALLAGDLSAFVAAAEAASAALEKLLSDAKAQLPSAPATPAADAAPEA